jgi:hypothetical protein
MGGNIYFELFAVSEENGFSVGLRSNYAQNKTSNPH